MQNGGFIQNKDVGQTVPYHVSLKWLKLKTLDPDGVIKKG